MSVLLCLRVTFLDPVFHGQRDEGLPEWPPSPLRLFQALVAATAARCPHAPFGGIAGEALRWLERQPAPRVVACSARPGQPIRTAVPNNDLDLVARAWARGREPSKQPNQLKTMKTVRALHLPDEGSVFYLWPLTPESLPQRDSLFAALDRAARGIVALGWGQNLVMAHLRVLEESDLANLPGDRWVPGRGREWLRLPIPGTLDRLIHRREVFLKRVQGNRYEHISDLDTQGYRVVAYHREAEPEPLPTVGFALRQPQGDKRVSFAPTNWTMRVAGMLRHALSEAAQRTGRPKDWIARYILGHEPQGGVLRGGLETRRFGYVPLPSLLAYGNTRRIGPIQRVLLTAPPGDEAEIAWASQLLAGQTLLYRHLDEGTTTELAVLSPTSAADCFALNAYQGRSRIWSSVTPVVLPGRDDGKPAKTERLIRRCLEHAGLPTQARIHWQLTGYHRGVEWAKRYQLPMSQQTPVRYHVRIEFEEPLAGPIVLGAGRYFGGGLMIANLDKEGMQE